MDLMVQENKSNNGMMEVAISRQAQEVQAAMVIAQRFPRDTNRAFSRVIEDCKRRSLAEKAVYSYPRGGQTVSGPSIRLAESIAKAWGNLDFGVIELDRKPSMGNLPGESTVMSYAWDLETNTRSTKIFTVVHKRDTKNGSYKLTDERDIYEAVANYSARRLRASILAILPADIVEKAVEQCRLSLRTSNEPLVDRVRKMIVAFKDIGVSQEMIESKLGHKLDLTTDDEMDDFIQIYNSIKDNVADRSDFFTFESVSIQKEEVASETVDKKVSETKSIKSKTIKNHAPQTPEEATSWKPKEDKQNSSEQNVKEAKTEEKTRKELVDEMFEIQKTLNMANDDLKKIIFEMTNKNALKDISNDELSLIIIKLYGLCKELK